MYILTSDLLPRKKKRITDLKFGLRGENFKSLKPESQNFLDPGGFAKPQSWLNLRFKNTDLG